jgi:uncharacterized phage protein (TIGR01671 family)
MREIKFRAWDKIEKKMCEVWSLKLDNIGCPQYASVFGNERTNCDFDTIELMQFTGLEDSKGNEIYEGDILRILYSGWPSQTADKDGKYKLSTEDYMKSISVTGQVVFERDRWCIQFDFHTDSIITGERGKKEVIGNIYEHPNLVKQ